jgi:membrane fusion protein, multidrug efflux system
MNNKLMQRFVRIQTAIGICIPILFYGCGPANGGKDARKQERPALLVATVQRSDATVTTGYAALLEGKVNVEIRPQVDGTLQQISRTI